MILLITLLIFISATVQVSHIPAPLAKSLVTCRLEFERKVREVYPDYHIVTGEQFISQFDISSCSVVSSQTHTSSSCSGATTSCSDEATSVIQTADNTLYYCYTDNKNPKPMTATLLTNGTYSYSSGGLGVVCLHDASKHSFVSLNSAEQILYIASDASRQDNPWLHYYTLSDQTARYRMGYVEDVIGMFTRGEFLYTVYIDNKKKNKIARSCKKELSKEPELLTYTYTDLECLDNIGGEQVILDRVLALEYSASQDKLYVLITRDPISSSAVSLCAFDVAQDIDQVFDTTQYYTNDMDGNKVKSDQDKIECSKSRTLSVLSESVTPAKTSNVVMQTKSTDIFAFSSYETSGNLLFYVINQDSLQVYDYKPATGRGRLIIELVLWDTPNTLSIYNDLIYLTSDTSVTMMPTYWCSYYGQDPVSCLAAMHPSCSYSKSLNKCVHTEQCTVSDGCVQDLETGSFSSLFPQGYTFLARGSVCIHDVFIADVTYTYFPNSSYVASTSYRDCKAHPVTTSPVINQSRSLSQRETSFLVVMVVASAGCLVLIMIFIVKGKSKLCPVLSSHDMTHSGKPSLSEDKTITVTAVNSDMTHVSHHPVDICKSLDVRCMPSSGNVRYNLSDDQEAIVTPGTPLSTARERTKDPLSQFNTEVSNGDVESAQHQEVYRNPSSGALKL